MNADQFIIDTITYGYSIPFECIPKSIVLLNNKSASDNENFVDLEINSLLHKGIITKCDFPPTVVNPLSVAQNSQGKKRLILDLRHVNKCVRKDRFKLEGVKNAIQYCKVNDCMFKFDLKSGYHHLDINPFHVQYLGFCWKETHYCFSVLPFGLSSAPFIFTQLLKPLVKHWREKGYRILVYLDDGFGFASSNESCQIMSNNVKQDLRKAGFITNTEKSIWEPHNSLDWLGFIWDTSSGTLTIPEHKISKLLEIVRGIVLRPASLTPRVLASVTGTLTSFQPSLGNICSLMTRVMHMVIANSVTWDCKIVLTDEIKTELLFWLNNLEQLPSKCFFNNIFIPQRIVYTDASNFAGAGFLVECADSIVHRMWTPEESLQSSTFRELKAVETTIVSLISKIRNRTVKLYTDNQNVVKIIKSGSMKKSLHDIAINIFSNCIQNQILLEAEWIPRSENEVADYFSKMYDYDDWSISDTVFQFFNNKWGPYDVDLFADCNNFKVTKFFSKFWTPGTSGVDALVFNWKDFNAWIVPPVCMVPAVINHMLLCRAKGTLVVPKWTSSCFWPLLVDGVGHFKAFVVDYYEYVKPRNFFLPGSDGKSIFAQPKFMSNVLVLKLNCQ